MTKYYVIGLIIMVIGAVFVMKTDFHLRNDAATNVASPVPAPSALPSQHL